MSSSAHLQREASAARVGLSSALDDLRDSVSTTALTNGAMTFAKEGSTAVARAAIDRAMASPLAAMLIGAGVFMLMTGGNKDSQVGAAVDKGNEAIKSTASTLAGVGSSIAGAASSALSAVSRASGAVSSAASHASGAVSDTAVATADKLKTAAGDASSMATGAYGKAKSTVEDLTVQGRDQGKQAIDQTQAMVTEAQGRLEQFAREQPILVAALGVAFGAALGASLPMTKAEQDYMGAAARKAADLGTDIAKKVADSVTHKVSGGDVKAKVGEVADAITSTITGGDVKAKVDDLAGDVKARMGEAAGDMRDWAAARLPTPSSQRCRIPSHRRADDWRISLWRPPPKGRSRARHPFSEARRSGAGCTAQRLVGNLHQPLERALPLSRIRRMALHADRTQTSRTVATVPLGGAKMVKLANMRASHRTSTIGNSADIESAGWANRRKRVCARLQCALNVIARQRRQSPCYFSERCQIPSQSAGGGALRSRAIRSRKSCVGPSLSCRRRDSFRTGSGPPFQSCRR